MKRGKDGAERRTQGMLAPVGQLCAVAAFAMYVADLPSMAWAVVGAVGALLSPTPLLVFLVTLLYRDPSNVVGALTASDLVMLLVVVRASPSLRDVKQHRHSMHSGFGLLLVAVLVAASMVSGGSLTPLIRLALIVAFGFALGLSIQNMHALRAGLTVLLAYEVGMALVNTPSRLAGSVIQDPAQLGTAAALLFFLWRLPARSQLGRVAGLVLSVVGVVWSFTRGVWFAFVISLAGIRVARHAPVVSLAAVPIIAYITFGFADRVTAYFGLNRASAAFRSSSIEAGLQDFLASPLIGNGWSYEARSLLPGQLASSGATYNVLVYVGAAAGIVGLSALVLYLAVIALALRKDAAAFVLVLFFLGSSMTEMPLYPQSFSGLLGLAVLPAAVAWSRAGARLPTLEEADRESGIGSPSFRTSRVRWHPSK